VPTFSVLLPRESRVVKDAVGRLRITLLNPRAEPIKEATLTSTRDDFELQVNGPWDYGETYINKNALVFPKPTYDWGHVHGFRTEDMTGKIICKSKSEILHYIVKGNDVQFRPGSFILALPE
jgi:hypothetical protein